MVTISPSAPPLQLISVPARTHSRGAGPPIVTLQEVVHPSASVTTTLKDPSRSIVAVGVV